MLDFDGTLVPIASTPESIQIPESLPSLLKSLQKAGHKIVIVSGRRIKNIQNYLNPLHVKILGLHGLEDDSEKMPQRNNLLDKALGKLKVLQSKFPNLLIEDKEFTIAIHTRALPKHLQKTATIAAMIICNTFVQESETTTEPLDFIHGDHVVELRPLKANKTLAVQKLIAQFPHLYPIYIGDDTTDEDAFVSMPNNSLSIRLGHLEEHTKAKYRLKNVDEVYQFLKQLPA